MRGNLTPRRAHASRQRVEDARRRPRPRRRDVTVPAEVQALLDQRAAARKAKDFAKSDELRKAIEALGWKVKDTAKGQEVPPA